MTERLRAATPTMLAVLRIMTALLFAQHGLQKLFGYPPGGHSFGPFHLLSIVTLAALLELVGGALLLVGLFTRPVAFVLCGEMAVAYFGVHFANGIEKPGGLFPATNGGELAVLFCFVFLFLTAAGPGRWALDRRG